MKIQRLANYKFNNNIIIELGSKIKKAREECGLSQIELSKLMGNKSGTFICLLENNQRQISAVDLWKISQITNLPITFFI